MVLAFKRPLVKRMVLVLTKPVKHHKLDGFGFTEQQNLVKYMVLALTTATKHYKLHDFDTITARKPYGC